MNLEEVLALVKAGFTREEISKLLQPAPAADPAPAIDPAPAKDPAPATDPAPAVDPAPAPAEPEQTPAWAQALSESLAALTKAVQTSNAMHDEQPPAQNALDAVLMKQLH